MKRTILCLLVFVGSIGAQEIDYELGSVLPGVQDTRVIGGHLFASGENLSLQSGVLLKSNIEGQGWLWQVLGPGGAFVPVATEEGGKVALFLPVEQGKYMIMLSVWTGDGFKQTHSYLDVGIVPGPGPTPGPSPAPGPVDEVHVLIIEESGLRTAAQAAVITSQAVRLAAGSGRFHVYDQHIKDASGATPESLKPWIEKAKARGLPTLFIHDGAGKVVYEGDIPPSVTETVNLINQYKPAKSVQSKVQRPVTRIWCDPRTGRCYRIAQ